MASRVRFCQRDWCGTEQVLWNEDDPRPCRKCGGTNFADRPAPLRRRGFYELSDADRIFLRVNRIDPEGD